MENTTTLIADLTDAVNAAIKNLPHGTFDLEYHLSGNGGIHDFTFKNQGENCLFSIDANNISQWYCIVDQDPIAAIYTNGAAYVDSLRAKGYPLL